MMKLYFFTGNDSDTGVFIGAETWREARNMVIGNECMHDCEFIDIRGSMCKENGKVVHTEVKGEHEAHELLAIGYTKFWWNGECDKCHVWQEHLDPIDGKLICSDCQEEEK